MLCVYLPRSGTRGSVLVSVVVRHTVYCPRLHLRNTTFMPPTPLISDTLTAYGLILRQMSNLSWSRCLNTGSLVTVRIYATGVGNRGVRWYASRTGSAFIQRCKDQLELYACTTCFGLDYYRCMWRAVFTMNATLVCIYSILVLFVNEVLCYLICVCFYVIFIYM